MPLTMGVDMVERSNKTKAMKKRSVKGVAGRSIVMVGGFFFLISAMMKLRRERILCRCWRVNECA